MSGGTGFGITINGFVMPQLTDLKTDLEQGLITQFGAGINLSPESFFGQFVGLVSERLSLIWQAMQDVYNSQSPDTAFGASLDNVGALRGIPRLLATDSSIQNVRLFGIAGTVVPNTFRASVVGSPNSIFQIASSITLVTGQSCVQHIAFSGLAASGNWSLSLYGVATTALSSTTTALQLQTAIQALPFASGCSVTGSMAAGFDITFTGVGAAGGFMVQPLFLVVTDTLQTVAPAPITITPSISTPGIDQGNAIFNAIATGPTAATAGSLTVIVTPTSGVTNVDNTQDAQLGTNKESDNAYRARMANELQIAGAGTVEAIRARLLATPGVKSVFVYENITDITDLHGRPPHSFEAVVSGGTDSDVAETIWLAKPAGIPSFGTTMFTITDSQGQPEVIKFSRPTIVDIYVIANITISGLFPVNGDDLVKEALANYIASLNQGTEVNVIPLLISQLAPIPGIEDAELLVGLTPGPTLPDNIPIAPYQQAYSQTSFVTVNHV